MSEPKGDKAPKNNYELVAHDRFIGELDRALPSFIKADLFSRSAQNQILKTPKLRECSQSSLTQALLDCASCGLLPDGNLAALVPFGGHCTLIIGYKGYVQMAHRTDKVADLGAEIVCKDDDFEWRNGRVHKHSYPAWDSIENRGGMVGAWAWVQLTNGGQHHEKMSKAEIDAVRDRTPAAKKKDSPWNHPVDYYAMAKKTVFLRAKKWIPYSPEFMTAAKVEQDEWNAQTVQVESSKPAYDLDDRLAEAEKTDLGKTEEPTKPVDAK